MDGYRQYDDIWDHVSRLDGTALPIAAAMYASTSRAEAQATTTFSPERIVTTPDSRQAISLRQKFASFAEHWSPKIVAELNGQHVKLSKFRGEFVWHAHEHEDELFLVHRGSFRMEFRDRSVMLREGEFLVVPRGVEHRPVADEEVEVILFEPADTRNTGNADSELTIATCERI